MEKLTKDEEHKILREAQDRFKILYDANRELHDEFKKNMKFSFNLAEGHWDGTDLSNRIDQKRPAITAHKLGKFVSQVVNSERGLPDRDLVIPVDGQADRYVARIYNEIIEDIEYHSNYDEIITTEGEYAVGGGFGFWRIMTEYTDKGFDQVVRIKPIINPLMVFLEDRGRYAFIRESMSLEEFEERWPDHKKENSDFEGQAGQELWYEGEKVFIAEYFRRVPVKKMLAEIIKENGTKAVIEINEDEKVEALRTREVDSYKVEWFKLGGHSILDRGEWIGDEIPIVEVDGHKIWLDGKVYKKSLTNDAKSMNQAYNYWFTSLTEKIALAPKAPFMVTPRQLKGHEKMWDTINQELHNYVLFNPTPDGAPARTPVPEVSQGELMMLNIADQNIRDVLGMYETSVGMGSNERSGKAIMARAARSELGTYHFPDNLRKAKLKTKKMILRIIPKVYDNARVMRLTGRKEPVEINTPVWDNELGRTVTKIDLSVGQYDIRASNPMNPSIRQQAADALREAMQYAGEGYAPVILPEFLKNLDVPGMMELSQKIEARTKELEAQRQEEIRMKQGTDISQLMET